MPLPSPADSAVKTTNGDAFQAPEPAVQPLHLKDKLGLLLAIVILLVLEVLSRLHIIK